MAHQRPSHISGGGSGHLYGSGGGASSGKPKARSHDELELALSGLRDDEDDLEIDPRPHNQQTHHSNPHHHHHHHHLPDQPPPQKMARTGGGQSTDVGIGVGLGGPSNVAIPGPSAVGLPGSSSLSNTNAQNMPAPASRPRGPKLKFTTEDDQLLVDLKENKALTWKQIAEFFPGRSSGTLQVRYCTKLKAKTTQWTDETVIRLRNAIAEYEQDRWKIIASKVGAGFTPAACREKAKEL